MPRRRLLLMAAFTLALPALANAAEWSKSFRVTEAPTAEIFASDANIRVTTWDRKEVRFSITTHGWKIGDGGIRIRDSQDGNRVRVEVREPHFQFSFGSRSVLVEVQMPSAGQLDVVTGDGNVHAADLKGALQIRTGDGQIVLDDIVGELNLDTGDGDIRVRNFSGAMTAHTGDGRIEVSGTVGALDLESGDGNILVEALNGSSVEGGWHIRTGDGNLTLRLPSSLDANLDAHTGDGSISSELPIRASGEIRSRSIRGELNHGGPTIRLSSGDGNIRIESL